jgi:plastocyanin
MVRAHMTRRRLGSFVLLVAVGLGSSATAALAGDAGPYERIEAIDNVFTPKIVRVPVGATVEWENGGRTIHDVVADDGSFRSTTLRPGDTFEQTFPTQGAFAFHCSYHGSPGVGMSGVVVVGDAPLPGAPPGVGPGREPPPAAPGPTLRVPQDFATIQSAVDHARPGGLVVVSAGVYREAVVVTTPFLTIRGTDRNRVVLDGGTTLDNGIQVIEADGVSIENMTAHSYRLNGFAWSSVFGYRGSYLTAYDNGDYGLFAYDSRYGQFDHSYASGSPDSGFYIGQCYPCDAVITDVLAENNAIGYSGTNAGGRLYVVNSEWRDNFAGIVPNTLDTEQGAPQRGVVIAGNWVHDNDNADAAANALAYPSLGNGIIVTGGRDNLITRNLVEGHDAFGILLAPNIDANVWLTSGNVVRDNSVGDSGRADIALAAPSAGGDCFQGNDFSTSMPPALEWRSGCGSPLRRMAGGSLGVTMGPLVRFVQANGGGFTAGDWRTQPTPPAQPSMPFASKAPPDPAIPGSAIPEPFTIRDARSLDVHASHDVSEEVTVLGFPLATSWWGILIGLYAYALPLILYSAWVSIALWDLVRQEAVPNRIRVAWMAVVLLVPLLGPVGYFALGRSPIQRSLRWMLVAGGLAVYAALAAVGVLVGSS